jgi:tetratricopeptide (TPR) repeat protein
MTNLASSYHDAGRQDEALKLREEVLTLRRKVSGAEHRDTLWSMGDLANSYHDAGRRDEALSMREAVLGLRRRIIGPEHPDTLWSMTNLAMSYHDAGRLEEALKLREEVLTLRRKVSGSEHPDTIRTMDDLANSYTAAGRWEEALPLLAEASGLLPNDSFLAQKVTVLQVWFGKEADYAATCRRVLELVAGTDNPSVAELAAKAYCLLPSSDPHLLEAALTLARRAVDLGKTNQYLPYYQMALGMAEYRSGSYPAADAALTAAELAGKDNRHVRDTARFFHAMSLFQQGKAAEARKLFTTAEAQMKPLPAEGQPTKDFATPDDLICWLAYKETKTLLRSSR